jgi:hypothetical protein
MVDVRDDREVPDVPLIQREIIAFGSVSFPEIAGHFLPPQHRSGHLLLILPNEG